ncbi:MAG: hypothetical protein L0206_02665 [Actinobacteria bacterium]|nr:hypothetical protein [Actinomycetota bacterium]
MCHDITGLPALPPIAGGSGAASSARLVIDTPDGDRLRAFAATAIDPEAGGTVILPDVRGLHPFYEDLAVRFAEAGIHATATTSAEPRASATGAKTSTSGPTSNR